MNLIESANEWMGDDYINEISQAATKKVIDKFVKQGEDENEVIAVVNQFNDLTAKNKIKGVNIFGLKFDDLKKEIDKAAQTKSRSEKAKIIRDKETEFVFENDVVLVISPKTHASSCKYGSNTQWCTTMSDDKYWTDYRKKGDKLYYIIPKDGSDKTAVKVSRNGYMEIYNAVDDEVGQAGLDDVLEEYNIDENIFEGMDDEEYQEVTKLTDEEKSDYAEGLLRDMDITTVDAEYDDAKEGIIQLIEQRYYDYEGEVIDIRLMITSDFEDVPYNVEQALKTLQDKYGIDAKSIKNKISVMYDAITAGDDLNYYIDKGQDHWSVEEVKDRIKNDYYEMDNTDEVKLETFINVIGFEFDDVLDDAQEEKLEKRLTYEYNNDSDAFESFYDDFVELSDKYLNAGEKIPEELITQIKELIDKVSKVEYGKQGHPNLNLESLANAYYNTYLLEN